MSWYSLVSCVFLLYNCPLISSFEEDYYWREYSGTIPDDAIIGGQDINGKNVYIGQAFVKDKGLIVGAIYPGVKEISVPISGVTTVDSHIKILCGSQKNFYWANANLTALHLFLIDKHAVVGGHEEGQGSINIGRISLEGGVKIGKINSFKPGDSRFHYVHNGEEKNAELFEILLYKDNRFNLRAYSPYFHNLK